MSYKNGQRNIILFLLSVITVILATLILLIIKLFAGSALSAWIIALPGGLLCIYTICWVVYRVLNYKVSSYVAWRKVKGGIDNLKKKDTDD